MLEWLRTILGDSYTEDIDKAVSAEIGKNFVAKGDFNTKNEELKSTQTLLETANTTIQGYKDLNIEDIQKSVQDWETKYNTDTKDLKDQLENTKKTYAAERSVSGMKFTSEAAKKAYISDLLAKNLPLQDGKFLGQDEFTENYKKNDPGVFAPEVEPPTFTMGGTAPKSGAQEPTSLAGALKERYQRG